MRGSSNEFKLKQKEGYLSMTSLKSGLLNFYHFLSSGDVSFDLKDPYQTLDVMQLWMT